MIWIRLTSHWVVSDCDLEKVSACTPSRGLCRVTYARSRMRMCVEFRDEILLRGENVKPRKNLIF